jgi:hypothetical protein
MCKESIYSRLIKKGFLSLETLLTNALLVSKNLLTRAEILRIMGALLYDGHITELDLDTFITNTWITTEEKAVIISEKAPC